MPRRVWVLALGAGLCSSLLPACTRTVAPDSPTAPYLTMARDQVLAEAPAPRASEPAQAPPHRQPGPAQDAATRDPVLAQAPENPPESPYHPLPPPLLIPATGNDRKVQPPIGNDPQALPEPSHDKRVEQAEYPEPEPPPGPAALPPVPTTIGFQPLTATESRARKVASAPLPPRPGDPPLVRALRCFLEDRPAEAVSLLKPYEKVNQELLLCLLPLAARLTEGSVSKTGGQDIAFFLDQVNNLEVPLRTRAALMIDTICFCSRIHAFGVYDPIPENQCGFRPGDAVNVYLEVRNFSSERQPLAPGQALWVTRLRTLAWVEDERGHKVWPRGSTPFEFHREGPDESRTLRHDYFDHCYFKIPDIPEGSAYKLWIEVREEATRRTAKKSLDFEVIR